MSLGLGSKFLETPPALASFPLRMGTPCKALLVHQRKWNIFYKGTSVPISEGDVQDGGFYIFNNKTGVSALYSS